MIQVKQGKMADSTAHVFVYILTQDGLYMQHVPEALRQKSAEIIQSIGAKKRLGRLWIYPFKQKWPEGLGPTPNGEASRTVWGALIPQQQEAYDYYVGESLFLLKRWMMATGLPLRVAVCDNGSYYKGGGVYNTSDEFRREAETILKEWDIEIYRQ